MIAFHAFQKNFTPVSFTLRGYLHIIDHFVVFCEHGIVGKGQRLFSIKKTSSYIKNTSDYLMVFVNHGRENTERDEMSESMHNMTFYQQRSIIKCAILSYFLKI